MEELGNIGFIGVGTISTAIVNGLLSKNTESGSSISNPIFLSPRGKQNTKELHSTYPDSVVVCESNQEVVAKAQVVFIGVLPQQVQSILSELKFASTQRVVSLVAGASMETLKACIHGTTTIDRVIPLPSVAHRKGVSIVLSNDKGVVAMFDLLGKAVTVNNDGELGKLCPIPCIMGPYYRWLQVCEEWCIDQGVPKVTASSYIGHVMSCIAVDGAVATNTGGKGFQGLIDEQTPGGYNAMSINELEVTGVFKELKKTLTSIYDRTNGKKPRKPISRRKSVLTHMSLGFGSGIVAGISISCIWNLIRKSK